MKSLNQEELLRRFLKPSPSGAHDADGTGEKRGAQEDTHARKRLRVEGSTENTNAFYAQQTLTTQNARRPFPQKVPMLAATVQQGL